MRSSSLVGTSSPIWHCLVEKSFVFSQEKNRMTAAEIEGGRKRDEKKVGVSPDSSSCRIEGSLEWITIHGQDAIEQARGSRTQQPMDHPGDLIEEAED